MGLLLSLKAQQKIKIEHSDNLSVSPRLGSGVQLLKGNVSISTQGAILYCDSAYFRNAENTLQAFGRVRLVKGSGDDKFTVTGKSMFLNGNSSLAQVRDSVVLVSKDATLNTNFFDYKMRAEEGHFWNGGVTRTGESVFSSDQGFFFSKKNLVHYFGHVNIDNKDFKVTANDVYHNTKTDVSTFTGNTHIINEDNIVDCQRAYYNNKTKETAFAGNANLFNNGQTILADSIHYNKEKDLGFAFGNISIIDTSQNMVIKGNNAQYSKEPNRMKISNKAYLIQYSETDTLYVHGDTLSSDYDKETDKRVLYVYNHVKIFNKNYQAKADSMFFSTVDSTIRLIGKPVLWADNNQITADKINLYTANNKVERMELQSNPFITFPESGSYYNQIKGKEIIAYLFNNKLNKIDVTSNAESIYYPKDSTTVIGYNKTESKRLVIHLKNSKVQKIAVYGQPKANMNPLSKLTKEDFYLRGFAWLPELRPTDWQDIFSWR
jgi:lipopolysaccharide assembly outer membrane protein LptD (OstA)